MARKKYVNKLDNVCLECDKERALNEFGLCSDCILHPGKEYDYSEIIIYEYGYADKHRPAWHKKVKF